MKKSIAHSCLFAILFLTVSMSLFAENILLKKGGTIQGKVVEQDQNKLKVKKPDGSIVTVQKSEILKVVYKDTLTAAEEEKLRKAEEEKERVKREKEEAARLKKEAEDAKKAEKELATQKAKDDAEAEKKRLEAEKLAESERKNLTALGATWRSAVLPGWGQWKQGRKIQAIVYPSLVALGLFFTYDKHRMYLNAKRDYNNLENPYSETGLIRTAIGGQNTQAFTPEQAVISSQLGPFKGQRESVERHYREMQYIGVATLLVYAWNVFDAYYFHPTSITADGKIENSTPSNKFFMTTSADRMDFGAMATNRTIDHKTNIGYEFYF